MTSATAERPTAETAEAVYSNFDHSLDPEVLQQLTNAPGEVCAQHAAWSFCGYVWQRPDGQWMEQVWRYSAPVEDIEGNSIEEVIEQANDNYGWD